ncbi:1-aminocyclopropane-1-carboxylate deaminase [Dulcicalothrix desertica PCC 7102]|uniref:1-aminocyclopropane-1-carboxylate deaminase n=1 Tax=Dulcicalothrix desertica PCC 7102 TaxID=232991 RepID=A0A3S1CMB6_9CYAN|nr:pyridoxal-phosphate dependent enzyme [Dulcicalothrix desertica]RUT06573.1 1-aminocyclopropane-1-carboxylate deaminase [Dulcicalothrix desertica PCC 7102]TWH50314.1 1-aminocyclopropane-1-carboxylate deaminase [Dulcicalothrix desertica PCC 7102]
MSPFASPPIQKIDSKVALAKDVELYVLRLDLVHPLISGNKWYKLKYNLEAAKRENLDTILTFGGAYSNHIYATAAAGNLFGLKTIGVIRGEETLPLNPTLEFATSQGMQLVYVDRQTYKQRNSETLRKDLLDRFGKVFIIPEGGCNLDGVRGCREIISQDIEFDVACIACGTGTTLAGVALSLNTQQHLIGFPVLKGGDFLKQDIEGLMAPYQHNINVSWELICNYHFGGYAKVNDELLRFAREFEMECGVPLDYVYTAKMFYGVMDLVKEGYFDKRRVLLIHTGGLQGNVIRDTQGCLFHKSNV